MVWRSCFLCWMLLFCSTVLAQQPGSWELYDEEGGCIGGIGGTIRGAKQKESLAR